MFSPESYTIIASLFPRLLGLIYFVAHGALLFQVKGLIGKNGILPISSYLKTYQMHPLRKRLAYFPTLFWINSTDAAILTVLGVSPLLSMLLMFGFFPPFILFALFIIQISIICAGQEFLSFGWESFLLEITVYAFLMSLTPIPNTMVWIGINFLLFRFHFQAGMIKLQTHDPSWKNLKAIAYHYQTQPLPNAIAWYAVKLPLWFNQLCVLMVFGIELVLPFGIFGPDWMRLIVFIGFFILQFSIWLTGNFSYLNHLTLAFSTILLSNVYLSSFFTEPTLYPVPFIAQMILSLAGFALLCFQIIRLLSHFWPLRVFQSILYYPKIFHFANRYAIFGSMTTHRYEIVVEGSHDGKIWKEYLFWFKPSEIDRRPRWFSPYQPRLDWQAWFLPFHSYFYCDWFQQFLTHLLKGTPEVLKLLRQNPFQEHPPKYVRAMKYEYEFSNAQEKKSHGWWWRRTLISTYSPTISLK